MKQLFRSLGCGLVLVAMVAGAAFGDATIYNVDSTLQTNGFEREGQRLQVDASGRLWGAFKKTNSSTAKVRVFYSNVGITSFTRGSDLFNVVNSSDATGVTVRGDTIALINSMNTPTNFTTPIEWAAFTGAGTMTVFDTAGFCDVAAQHMSGNGGLRLFGDGHVSYLSVDSITGVAATARRLLEHHSDRSGGWQQDPLTWLCHDYVASASHGGRAYVALPYRAVGHILIDIGGQGDVWFIDTSGAASLSNIATNIIDPLEGSWRQAWFIPYGKPSSGINAYGYECWDSLACVAEVVKAGNQELHFYMWEFTGGATPTSMTKIRDTTILTDAAFPPVAHDSCRAEAGVTVNRTNGDIFVIAKTWPDTSVYGTYGLSYWQSTNRGTSFGSAQVFKAAGAVTGSNRAHRITDLVTPWAFNDVLVAGWKQGGAAAGADTLKIATLSLTACADYSHSLSVTAKTNTTATIQDNVGNASAPLDALVLQIDDAIGFGSMFYNDSITNATIPDDFAITGMTQNTKYYYRFIAQDAGCRDTSAIDSLTTYKTITQSLASSAITSVGFTVTNTFVANTVTKHRLLVNTANSIGTATPIDSATTALPSPKALNATGLTASTKYYLFWQITDELGVTSTASPSTDSVTTSGADITPPAAFTGFVITRLISLDADSIEFKLGTNGDADAQKIKVRYSTSAWPATVTDGTSLFDTAGFVSNNDTRKSVFTVTQPSWVYVAAFVGDEVPNWSTAARDSIYAPSSTAGTDLQSLIVRFDSLRYLFGTPGQPPSTFRGLIGEAVYAYTQDGTRLMRASDTSDIIIAFLNHKLPANYYLAADTSIGALLNAYGAYGWDINNVPLGYVSNVANLQKDAFNDSSATDAALTEIGTKNWATTTRTLTTEVWNSNQKDSILSALRDTKWATPATVWAYGGGRALTDKANFTLASGDFVNFWNVSAGSSFSGGSMGVNLSNPNYFTGASVNYTTMADAVWNRPFSTNWAVGSMGDSLTNPSYMQGGAGLTGDQIANAVWDATQATHTSAGTFGLALDATISSRSTLTASGVWANATRTLSDKTGFSLADYTGFWNVPFSTSFTTGTMGDSLKKPSYVQGAASGLSVSQIVTGVWGAPQTSYNTAGSFGSYLDSKVSLSGGGGGGTGTGAFSVTFVIVDTSSAPDSVVSNVPIYVNNLAQNTTPYSTVTNNNGSARFNLSSGTWVFFTNAAGYATNLDTVTITATKTDTLRLRRDNTGRTVVAFSLINSSGLPYSRAKLSFSLVSVNDSLLRYSNNTVVSNTAKQIAATADASGVANVPLLANSAFVNDSTYYTVEVRDSQQNRIIERWAFRVDTSSSAVQWNTITKWRP